MKIKLYLSKNPDKQGKYQVRISVSMLGKRYITSLGYSLSNEEFDNVKADFYKVGSVSSNKHTHHIDILYLLNSMSNAFEWEQTKILRKEKSIDDIDFNAIINSLKGREVKKKNDITPVSVWYEFIIDESQKKDLSKSTIDHMNSFYRRFAKFVGKKTFEEVATLDFVESWTKYNVNRGINNTSVKNSVNYLIWYLMWCYRKGYCGDDFKRYKFSLKTNSIKEKTIVFLTLDEIRSIEELELEGTMKCVRDMFVFQCYTGLRISDVRKIKKQDLNDGVLSVFIQKTGAYIVNRLNKHALRVIAKYLENDTETVFPYLNLTSMEDYLKLICYKAGIDEQIHLVDYRGNRKIESIVPKWQLITTHVGRKSFVVNSLDLGLTPTQVISYTGHSTIQAMQPYISISQKKKDSAMDVWNKIDEL